MTQWLRTLPAVPVDCPAPTLGGSLLPVIPAPGDPIPWHPWAPEQKAQTHTMACTQAQTHVM